MMGMTEYLAGLDRDQLAHLMSLASERIAAIDHEEKKVVWSMEDRDIRYAFFGDDEYVKGAAALLEKAKELAAKPNLKPRDKALHLVPIFVPASEYASYLES